MAFYESLCRIQPIIYSLRGYVLCYTCIINYNYKLYLYTCMIIETVLFIVQHGSWRVYVVNLTHYSSYYRPISAPNFRSLYFGSIKSPVAWKCLGRVATRFTTSTHRYMACVLSDQRPIPEFHHYLMYTTTTMWHCRQLPKSLSHH